MKKLLILLFVVLHNCLAVIGQDQFIDTTEIYSDSTYNDDSIEDDEEYGTVDKSDKTEFQKPTLRLVSSDSINKLRQQEDFEYMQYIDSFYRNTKPQKEELQNETIEKTSPSIFDITGIRVIYWTLALIAVLFVLYRLFMGNTALFTKNSKINPGQAEEEAEIPLTVDRLGMLIDKAISEKNYRLAIRLMYMQTLSQMGDKQLLVLSPQKTNYQYVQELNGRSLQQPFSKITMQYEYAWFGNFPINAQQFETIRNGYADFKKLI